MSQPATTTLTVQVAMDTHVGQKREQNQDAIGQLVPTDSDTLRALGQIFVLADGVGGLTGGDLASQYAVSTIISSYFEQENGEPPERLARAIAEANNVIYAEGQEQQRMATTVVAAVVRGRDLIVGSVGDSPAYLMRDAEPRKLTMDHTVENLASDTVPEGDPAGRKLVRALGRHPSVKVDIITGRVRHGDHVVLCSDGLTRYVSPEEIEAMVSTFPLARAVQSLIETANERGGADNISVIALQLVDETDEGVLTQLPSILDPMKEWGHPRSSERPQVVKTLGAPPADNPLLDLWRVARGNTMITGIGMSALLVIFVIIMLIVANAGNGDSDGSGGRAASPTPDAAQTATAQVVATETAQVAAVQTTDAILAATSAAAALRTLTPPTPVPTSGPQLASGMWFRVLSGDPIPAFDGPSVEAEPASDLEPDQNYRVTLAAHDTTDGPWYQVVDNLGLEVRWVSAPTMHQRIVVIDETGRPLPDDQQPLDVPPPSVATRTPVPTPSPLPTMPGTPGTPVTPLPTSVPTLTRTPMIVYGVESWEENDLVEMKGALDLCRVPEVTSCDAGEVAQGEIGTIVDGPIPSGEHWWWKVEFEDGRAGWIAQVLLTSP